MKWDILRWFWTTLKWSRGYDDETLDSRKPRSSIFSSKEDERLGERELKGLKVSAVYSESLELLLNFYGFWLKVNLILYQNLIVLQLTLGQNVQFMFINSILIKTCQITKSNFCAKNAFQNNKIFEFWRENSNILSTLCDCDVWSNLNLLTKNRFLPQCVTLSGVGHFGSSSSL